ncbi:ribonuclease H-like domain-containing protein [Tanacetum coccineum]
MNLVIEFENASIAKDDMRKAYEECNDIPEKKRALIDTFFKEEYDKDNEMHNVLVNYTVGPQTPPRLRIQSPVLKIDGNVLKSGHFGTCLVPRDDMSLKVDSSNDPRGPHFTALKGIVHYVRGTIDHGLQLHVSSTRLTASAYTNVDWASCSVNSSRSSDEVEYRSVANVVVETSLLRNILRELHAPLFTTTFVYCNNVSAVYMVVNPVQHLRTKHISTLAY